MAMKKTISLRARKDGLTALIKDAIEYGYNKAVLERYEKQLKSVEKEIANIKERQKKFRGFFEEKKEKEVQNGEDN